eukprot:1864734-Rhodomonas_salina.1
MGALPASMAACLHARASRALSGPRCRAKGASSHGAAAICLPTRSTIRSVSTTHRIAAYATSGPDTA